MKAWKGCFATVCSVFRLRTPSIVLTIYGLVEADVGMSPLEALHLKVSMEAWLAYCKLILVLYHVVFRSSAK